MSNIDRTISNEEVIPVFESDLFEGHEDAQFALGIIAFGKDVAPGREAEFDAYLRLRANVYADQTRMISKDLVRADGTEVDDDDARSVHFGLFERHELGARAVGSMRLIIKDDTDSRPLPIEDFFPEAFDEVPAPLGAVEVSRYICRHEVPMVQEKLSYPLFSGALAYIMAHKLGPTYGVVEPAVEATLQRKRVPMERIAEPRFVPEYDADNLGMVVDTELMTANTERVHPGMIATMLATEGQFNYFGAAPSPAPRTPTPPPQHVHGLISVPVAA